ncbi:MAG: efflux RND transporter periplasmic adaptor subunit [Proteobacteria bacterium]|nr:efflux RND transporter periplasmic adaptor subunit [Pseudomonadota bacterium]
MNVLEKMTKPFQRQPDAEEAPLASPPEAANDDTGAKARRRRIVILSGAVVLAVAIGIYIMSHVIGAEESRSPTVDQTQVVSVVPLAAHAFTPHVALRGEVRPKRDIHVFATASGVRVLQVLADEGDMVRQGQPLARLDTAMANAQTSAAQASVAEAESNAVRARGEYERAESIRDSGALSREAIEQRHSASVAADARLAAARAQLALVNAQVQGGYVRAPVAGLVISRSVELGATVNTQELFRIAGDNRLEVAAQISETDVISMRPGQNAVFRLADGSTVQGSLSRAPASIDERTRTGEALFDLPRDTRVRAGMHLSGEIELAQRQALAAPQDSIRYEDGRAYVFVVSPDSQVHKTFVNLGAREGDLVEITGGAAPGARIAGAGSAFLRDGDRVRPAQAPAPQRATDAEQLRGRQDG